MVIVSRCPKMGDTINALSKEGTIRPVFVKYSGITHKANSLFAALDFLKAQGYYHAANKEMAEFTYG